jgi:hypothetical protein
LLFYIWRWENMFYSIWIYLFMFMSRILFLSQF